MGFSIGPTTTFLGLGDTGSSSVPQSDTTQNSKIISKKLRNSNSNPGKTEAHSMGADGGAGGAQGTGAKQKIKEHKSPKQRKSQS